jgi:hypothetical protein
VTYSEQFDNAAWTKSNSMGRTIRMQGSYPTSYIPTSGTICFLQLVQQKLVTTHGDVNTFNDSEGVLFAEV